MEFYTFSIYLTTEYMKRDTISNKYRIPQARTEFFLGFTEKYITNKRDKNRIYQFYHDGFISSDALLVIENKCSKKTEKSNRVIRFARISPHQQRHQKMRGKPKIENVYIGARNFYVCRFL